MLDIYSFNLLLPALAVYLIFFILPSLSGIFYSFTYWDLFTVRYAGFENFKNILSDPDLNIAIKNTFIFALLTSVFKQLFGIILALFLNQKLKTRNLLRSIFFFPAILSSVAVGLIFSALMYPTGLINSLLQDLGLSFMALDWLGDRRIAIFSVSFVEVWKWTGIVMVLILAGLQSISKEYFEAANIDGANSIKKFWYITLPLIMPSFNNAFILGIIGGLKVFDIIYATTQGGPGTATDVMNSLVFKSFGAGRYGEASAANLLLTVIVFIITFAFYSVLRKKEVEV